MREKRERERERDREREREREARRERREIITIAINKKNSCTSKYHWNNLF